ncbi:MAG: hypothetical protein V4787_26790 [Pseudomonadota bacterium]
MSDAADRLARSRLAILQQIERREKRGSGRDSRREGERAETRARAQAAGDAGQDDYDDRDSSGGWFGNARNALRIWWRHHPAHMGLELATPMLSAYARKKPVQFLGIAAAVGAVVVVAKPWRLISATGLVMALLKSSQISSLVMSAMAGADFGQDRPPYEDDER